MEDSRSLCYLLRARSAQLDGLLRTLLYSSVCQLVLSGVHGHGLSWLSRVGRLVCLFLRYGAVIVRNKAVASLRPISCCNQVAVLGRFGVRLGLLCLMERLNHHFCRVG